MAYGLDKKKTGTVAAMATIKYFIENKVADAVKRNGLQFRSILNNNAEKYDYNLDVPEFLSGSDTTDYIKYIIKVRS